MTEDQDLQIRLDDFAGPLDLLLYLVRKEEVAIEALPLTKITEQYLAFIDGLAKVDVDRAGDFLVMAAQLVEWKARALLPASDRVDAKTEAEEARARSDLVADLLAYRELKERSRLLEDRADEAAKRYGRTSPRTIEEVPTLKNVDLWDLVTAFQRLEAELGLIEPPRVLADDDAPLYVFVERVRERLLAARREGESGILFRALFVPITFPPASAATTAASATSGAPAPADGPAPAAPRGPTRGELVATFLALLELIRLGEARARQGAVFGEIEIAGTDALGTGHAAPAPHTESAPPPRNRIEGIDAV